MQSLSPIYAQKSSPVSLGWTETVVHPIPLEYLPEHIQIMMVEDGRLYITRNSRCVCGSRKRFKRCCGKGIFKKKET